jgi:ssDNA-binding Zn-finger/Zn-ribbon topoisomerase 1
VQSRVPASNNLTTAPTEPDETPFCPACGKVMMLRTARRGKNAGNKFWGCPDYPGCKGTRQMQFLAEKTLTTQFTGQVKSN